MHFQNCALAPGPLAPICPTGQLAPCVRRCQTQWRVRPGERTARRRTSRQRGPANQRAGGRSSDGRRRCARSVVQLGGWGVVHLNSSTSKLFCNALHQDATQQPPCAVAHTGDDHLLAGVMAPTPCTCVCRRIMRVLASRHQWIAVCQWHSISQALQPSAGGGPPARARASLWPWRLGGNVTEPGARRTAVAPQSSVFCCCC